MAIVPDPQHLASLNTTCSLYDSLIQWAVDNRNLVVNGTPLNVKGFVQVGDCQDNAFAMKANDQEMVAVHAWTKAIAANMFVAWCCGNHDYENGFTVDRNQIGHAWRTDTTSRPAQPGETVMIFGTGFGPTMPAVPAGQTIRQPAPLADPGQLKITIGGVTAEVRYAGLVAVGEYQFNVIVPNLPQGDQLITAEIAGMSTQRGVVVPILP